MSIFWEIQRQVSHRIWEDIKLQIENTMSVPEGSGYWDECLDHVAHVIIQGYTKSAISITAREIERSVEEDVP